MKYYIAELTGFTILSAALRGIRHKIIFLIYL